MKSSFYRSALAPSLMWRLGGVARYRFDDRFL